MTCITRPCLKARGKEERKEKRNREKGREEKRREGKGKKKNRCPFPFPEGDPELVVESHALRRLRSWQLV